MLPQWGTSSSDDAVVGAIAAICAAPVNSGESHYRYLVGAPILQVVVERWGRLEVERVRINHQADRMRSAVESWRFVLSTLNPSAKALLPATPSNFTDNTAHYVQTMGR